MIRCDQSETTRFTSSLGYVRKHMYVKLLTICHQIENSVNCC